MHFYDESASMDGLGWHLYATSTCLQCGGEIKITVRFTWLV